MANKKLALYQVSPSREKGDSQKFDLNKMVLKFVSKKHTGDLKIDEDEKLGEGGYGSVFKGKYKKEEVAIKRVQVIDNKDSSREEEALQRLNHENVVKLHLYFTNNIFRFFVLELCAADLHAFCKGKYSGPIPSDFEVLLQLAKGLDYIHSQRLVHRDIKPQNILISKPSPVVMKWTDFGFTKPTNNNGSCSMSDFKGTNNWLAPEILTLHENQNGRSSKQSDIFSTGCVFFYFSTRGTHPFGKVNLDVNLNISKDDPINIHSLPENNFAKAIIIKMIAHRSEDRIALAEIINILDPTENKVQPPAVMELFDSIPLIPQSSQSSESLTTSQLDDRPETNKIIKSNNKKENVIPIEDLFLEKRKKPRWAIKARVTEKSKILDLEVAVGLDVPQKKYFFVILEDGSGKHIKARACTAKLCRKFYQKFQVGKEYLIKNADFDKSGAEPILSLRGKAEVIPQ